MSSENRATSKRRGQLFSLDVVVAIGIFILIMISCIWVWDYSREKVYLTVRRETLEISARGALSGLLENPGSPSNWHEDQSAFSEAGVNSLGLAGSRPWLLSPEKIQALQDWYSSENETYKTLLAIKGYDFHLEFWKYDSGFSPSPDYEVGSRPMATYNVVRLQRTALLNQGGNKYWLKIIMEAWEPE